MKKEFDLKIDGGTLESIKIDSSNSLIVATYKRDVEGFKAGDILASKSGDTILIFDKYTSRNAFSSLINNHPMLSNNSWYAPTFRYASIKEIEVFYKDLARMGKKWNSDKLEIEELTITLPSGYEIDEENSKPLFITEDGVEVLSDIDNLYAVNLTYFNKTKNTLRHSSWLIENSAYKVFYHEANADEYIWRNMRLFSYEDVVEWYGYGFKLGREGIYETLERLAIERSEQ